MLQYESMTTREQKIEVGTALLLRKLRRAREDFEVFVEEIWSYDPNLKLENFHREAIKILTDEKEKYVYWEAARGHLKTMLATALACWLLGRDPTHRIKFVCANDKEARKRLYEIKEQIEKNALLQLCFPHLKKLQDGEWNKSRIVIERPIVSKDPSIEAMGIMSGALGSRSTLIFLDDIVDMRNSILQPQLKEQVLRKLFGELIPTLEKTGRVIAVATPWTLSDANAVMKEKFRLIGPHKVGDGEDLYKPLFEYVKSREDLKKLREEILGPSEYARAYLCEALTGDTVPIQTQWIQYYDANILGDPYQYFAIQVYDLAIEQSSKNDWFAYLTALWDKKRNYVFIVDGWHDRLSFRKQAKTVIRNAKSWNPQEIVIEHGGYQGALGSYLSEPDEDEITIALPIYPFRTRGRNKERRITEVQPFFENGLIWFHPKFNPAKNPDIHYTAPIISELTAFPFAKWDDFADCVSMLLLTIMEIDPELFAGDDNKERSFEMGEGMQIRMTVI